MPGSDDETGLADVKAAAFDDLVALGDDLRALDLDISMPGVAPEAVADYTAAIDGYQEASLRFDRVATTAALRPVSEALEEGRFRLACAQARLAGTPLPTRRGPCFFDPRHGPATADVLWAPPGGVARPIAVCAPDADILAGGGEPEVREIQVAGASVPYWQAPAAFDAWAGGFYTPPPGRPLERRRPVGLAPTPPFAADLVAADPVMVLVPIPRTPPDAWEVFSIILGFSLIGTGAGGSWLTVTARVVLAALGVAGVAGGLLSRRFKARRLPAPLPPQVDDRVLVGDDGVVIGGRDLVWDDLVSVVVQRRADGVRVTFLPRLDERLGLNEPSYPVRVAGRTGWTCDLDSRTARGYQATVRPGALGETAIAGLVEQINRRCPGVPVQDERPGREWAGP